MRLSLAARTWSAECPALARHSVLTQLLKGFALDAAGALKITIFGKLEPRRCQSLTACLARHINAPNAVGIASSARPDTECSSGCSSALLANGLIDVWTVTRASMTDRGPHEGLESRL